MKSKVVTITNENYAEFLNKSYNAHLCRVRFNGSQQSTIYINHTNITIEEETNTKKEIMLQSIADNNCSTIYLSDFESWSVIIEME